MLRLVTFLLSVVATHAQGLIINPFFVSPACGNYTVETAVFDGTNDSLTRASITGIADGKAFTIAFWIKMSASTDGGQYGILWIAHGGGFGAMTVTRNTSNKLVVSGQNPAQGNILSATSNTSITVASGWTHVYVTLDLANSSNRHIYFNGVEDASVTWTTYVDDTIDLATTSNTIGANASAGIKLNAALAEFWFDDIYLDSISSFLCTTSGNHPISLGATGNLPTGSAPALYLSRAGSGDTWATDSSGNANNWTVNGALGSTTPP